MYGPTGSLCFGCQTCVSFSTPRSVDDPPSIPAFTGGRGRKPSHIAALTSAVTQMAQVMTAQPSQLQSATPISGNSAAASAASGISPAKLTNLRSNYLQQMRDLHSLFESGAISETEFREQKTPILDQLKKLVPSQ